MKKEEDVIPRCVAAAYVLNPYVVCSCVAMTTTVFANLILALTLWGMAKKSRIFSVFWLALASYQSFYPLMLIVPITLATAKEKHILKSALLTVSMYATFTFLLFLFSYHLTGSWRFVESTLGCM